MQPHPLIYILSMSVWLPRQSQIVTKTTWPAELKIFTIWLLKKSLPTPGLGNGVQGERGLDSDCISQVAVWTGWVSSGPGVDG